MLHCNVSITMHYIMNYLLLSWSLVWEHSKWKQLWKLKWKMWNNTRFQHLSTEWCPSTGQIHTHTRTQPKCSFAKLPGASWSTLEKLHEASLKKLLREAPLNELCKAVPNGTSQNTPTVSFVKHPRGASQGSNPKRSFMKPLYGPCLHTYPKEAPESFANSGLYSTIVT